MMGRSGRPLVILVEDDPAVTHAVHFSVDLEGLEVRSFRDGESLHAADPLPVLRLSCARS